MAQLLGVVCMDMDMIVPLDVLKSHSGYAQFEASVDAAKSSCSRVTVSDTQLETIRAKVSRDSVCDWSSYCAARAGDEETNSAAGSAALQCAAEATDLPVGAIVGGAIGGVVLLLCLLVCLCMAMRKKPAAQRPQNGMPAQQQATQMSSAAPYAATGQPVQPVAVAQPVVAQAQPMYPQQVPMGKVLA